MRLFSSLLVLCLVSAAVAQDEKAAPDAAAEFAKLDKEWIALDSKIEDVIKAYRGATASEERIRLRSQFDKLVEQSQKLLPKLRDVAVAAYTDKPNADERVVKTLVGVAANDVRSDHYAAALEVLRLLEKNGCTEPAINALAGEACYCLDDFVASGDYFEKAKSDGELNGAAEQYFKDVKAATAAWTREQSLRKAEAEADDLPRVKLETTRGTMVIELYENEAPQTVGNFVNLVEKKYYDGLTFHRVLPGFMAQGGCPDGTGGGGPGYNIRCECGEENHRKHFRGTLSMAHAGKNTGGSQFFLTFRRTAHLDGQHTVFGRVVEGLDVLAKLQRRNPQRRGQPAADEIVKAEVLRKRDHAYEPTKVP